MNFLTSISAGVPLTYCHEYGKSDVSIENLTINFLNPQFSSTIIRTYRKNGFFPYITFFEIFANEYTCNSGEKLQVRSMKAEDIYNLTGLIEMVHGEVMNLKDKKYNKLLYIGADYWIASMYNTNCLWYVIDNGNVDSSYNMREARCSSNCFSKVKSKNTRNRYEGFLATGNIAIKRLVEKHIYKSFYYN